MTTWKLTLEYDGSGFSGWQEQKNARTVAGEVRSAAQEFFRTDVELMGSGRTDAGVHALGQVAHIRVPTKPDRAAPVIVQGLNELLPSSIVVLGAERVHARFHARHDAIARTYLYQIATRKKAFMKRYVWWIKDHLDVDAMARNAERIAGRHDFVCFRAADPARPDESTIVVVESASIEVEADLILFRIEASHFLWRMVRRLVGVLAKVGTGEVSDRDFSKLIEGKCEKKLNVAAWTAPASGLFLESVRYPEVPPRLNVRH